jgi:hypothetical protein
MHRQTPAGRHPVAGAEPARKNAFGYHLPQLLLQRAARPRRQKERLGGDRHSGTIGLLRLALLSSLLCERPERNQAGLD